MKYLMFICLAEDAEPPASSDADTEAWVAEMDARRVRLFGSQLQPISDATTVRVRQQQVLLTDGPFAETKEQIVGFDLIEAADLDAALEVAARHPVATWGTIEVRPLMEL